ncbi:MAG: DUF6485 family protein [Spirochaetaceae bacterium]|nr:DUF6485 family protein [Spirochaetaceae bacterium]MCF7949192.1 DUF6485 family protein [Spirochaetia bacterium]MCF7951204.1 DUF6485 family protein [Spirochaetaceae bacterium]
MKKDCSQEKNAQNCNCTYPCSRKGLCCECITYHRRMAQLPACYFPDDIEAGYDRSVENFLRVLQERGPAFLRA